MTDQIKDLDVVALLEDIPSEGLIRGKVGTVVEDFGVGVYLIEFANRKGQAYPFTEVKGEQLMVLHFMDKPQMP